MLEDDARMRGKASSLLGRLAPYTSSEPDKPIRPQAVMNGVVVDLTEEKNSGVANTLIKIDRWRR